MYEDCNPVETFRLAMVFECANRVLQAGPYSDFAEAFAAPPNRLRAWGSAQSPGLIHEAGFEGLEVAPFQRRAVASAGCSMR